MIRRSIDWVDDRLGWSRFVRRSLDKIFPDNWSFMLGEVALYCLVVLILTGTYLTFFFVPSAKPVTYQGGYAPLRGVSMSEAYESTLRLSFDDRAGLLMRQIHHWAALVFLGAIVLHLCRIFFTGAFRRPRELNWIVGVTMLALAMLNGFSGYSLPDDLLSGTGLRIAYSVMLSIPLAGTWLAFLVFGGEFPADDITSRLFVLHVLLVPALLVMLLGVAPRRALAPEAHAVPGAGSHRDEHRGLTALARLRPSVDRLVHRRRRRAHVARWPRADQSGVAVRAVRRAGGVDRRSAGLVSRLAGGRPAVVPGVARPRVRLLGVGVVLAGHRPPQRDVRAPVRLAVPRSEDHRDRAPHHLLDRPRHRPIRTAIGVAALTFYGVLLLAGSQDVVAQHLGVGIATVTRTLQVAVFVAPLVAAAIAWKLCHDFAATDVLERENAPSGAKRRHPRSKRRCPPANRSRAA